MLLQREVSEPGDSRNSVARTKIYGLVQVVRFVAFSYTSWVLIQILRPWYAPQLFFSQLGRYWERDLASAHPWQISAAVLWDLGLWLLLVISVIFYWRAMGSLVRDMAFTSKVGMLITRGAWFGMACEVLTVATRPLWSYVLTLHLPADQHLLRWDIYPNDLLATILCFVLLIFAYLFAWMVDIAEENRGFV
jgi:hypothetical protein